MYFIYNIERKKKLNKINAEILKKSCRGLALWENWQKGFFFLNKMNELNHFEVNAIYIAGRIYKVKSKRQCTFHWFQALTTIPLSFHILFHSLHILSSLQLVEFNFSLGNVHADKMVSQNQTENPWELDAWQKSSAILYNPIDTFIFLPLL